MKVPKYIKELLKKRENVATELVCYDAQLNDWLDKKGVINECVCGEQSGLFNTGCIELESGSALATIEYLESLR